VPGIAGGGWLLNPLLTEIDTRLRALLEGLKRGDDAPPGPVLRLEGLCEAAVLTASATVGDVDALVERVFHDVLGRGPGESLGPDWRRDHPFPQLPLYMRRAPVSPSTPP
jgi:hypothetical protein